MTETSKSSKSSNLYKLNKKNSGLSFNGEESIDSESSVQGGNNRYNLSRTDDLNSRTDDSRSSNQKGNVTRTVFQPKLIKNNNSSNQNKVYDLSIASSSKGSSVTCSTDTSSKLKSPKQDKDYYYLGDPKDSQLYHIFKNVYTFDEAQEECVKRNGVLADPQQLANAYISDKNFCSWGWTNDGNAYLASQSKDCNDDIGILNGKNIDPYLRLGANCYGVPQ